MTAFSRTRAFIWPIHSHEQKKFMLMFLMFFFLTFNYNVLRTVKETLVVTAPGSGAEVIPFIKVWAMFPGTILLSFLFAWFSNRFTKEQVFYIFMSIFLGYFSFFLFYLLPNIESLHLHKTADFLQDYLPLGCKGFTVMLRHWAFTIFYVMSELWGNIIVFMVFWGFINQLTNIEEAKRFYGLFGLGGNLSGIFAGQMCVYCSKTTFDFNLPFLHTAWDQSLFVIMSFVLLCGFFTMFLFYRVNKILSISTDKATQSEHPPSNKITNETTNTTVIKERLSLTDSFKHLCQSKHLLYITLIIVTYNLSINLIEVLWKDQIRILYPSANDYNLFINQISTWIGVVATVSSIFVSGNAIRFLGWTTTALITPVILLITSCFFFGALFFRGYLESSGILVFGLGPLTFIVFVGALQNILCRSAKYTVFDATKEMAFLPLSNESKIKGKTVIDGVFNRLGKSGGSVIHQGLLIIFSSFAMSAPYVAVILLMILGVWMNAAQRLGRSFNALSPTFSRPVYTT